MLRMGFSFGFLAFYQAEELHGGTIRAESENESIVFTVELPIQNRPGGR